MLVMIVKRHDLHTLYIEKNNILLYMYVVVEFIMKSIYIFLFYYFIIVE